MLVKVLIPSMAILLTGLITTHKFPNQKVWGIWSKFEEQFHTKLNESETRFKEEDLRMMKVTKVQIIVL